MKKIDLLVQRYLDFTAASDALMSVDERNITAFFPSVSSRNLCHLQKEFLVELAEESGAELQRDFFTGQTDKLRFLYKGIEFYTLEKKDGTP